MPAVAFSPSSAVDWARAIPAGLAQYASYGRWNPVRHMMLMNKIALDVEARRRTRVIVNMPPQHGKSTFWSNYFMTHYLGTFPDHEGVVAGYEHSFASQWGARVRDNMQEFGGRLWGLGVDARNSASDDWRLTGERNGRPVIGGMRCAGLNSGLTGRPMHIGVIDDPFKDAVQAMSPTYRQRAWEWYQSVWQTRYQPDTVVIIVMTRWHEDDLVGRILENEADQWDIIKLPALAEDRATDPLGRMEGEALWPEKYSRKFMLDVQETRDAYWWASMYQQRPAPAGGGIFKKEWWSFWKPFNSNLDDTVRVHVEGSTYVDRPCIALPHTFSDAVSSWDLTFDSASSRVAGGAWRRRGAQFFLIDEAVGEWNFPRQVEEVRRFQPSIIPKLIEDKANARALVATSRSEIPGMMLEPVEGGDKVIRAMDVSPFVKAGNVFLPHPAIAPWVWEYIDEMAGFPTGRYDDRVDQTSQALRALHRRMLMRRSGGTSATASQENLGM